MGTFISNTSKSSRNWVSIPKQPQPASGLLFQGHLSFLQLTNNTGRKIQLESAGLQHQAEIETLLKEEPTEKG